MKKGDVVMNQAKRQAPPNQEPVYLTVEEVAEKLRCRPSTIYQYVHKKKIPFRKRCGTLLFEVGEIDQWTKDCAGR